VYGAAEFEAIKSAPLIKSQLTAGERPKRMMLQTANTEERADYGPSLRLQTKLGNMKKADARGSNQFFRSADAAKVGKEPTLHDAAMWMKVRNGGAALIR
jgi:hypothetical protein